MNNTLSRAWVRGGWLLISLFLFSCTESLTRQTTDGDIEGVPDSLTDDGLCQEWRGVDIGDVVTVRETDFRVDEYPSSCVEASSLDRSYVFTAPTSSYYVFSTEHAALALVSGHCGERELDCRSQNIADDGAPAQHLSQVVAHLDQSQRVTIVVEAGEHPPSISSGELDVTQTSCPRCDLSTGDCTLEATNGPPVIESGCDQSHGTHSTVRFKASTPGVHRLSLTGAGCALSLGYLEGEDCRSTATTCVDGHSAVELTVTLDVDQIVTFYFSGTPVEGSRCELELDVVAPE